MNHEIDMASSRNLRREIYKYDEAVVLRGIREKSNPFYHDTRGIFSEQN